jgi:isopenicillin N synthase-like dioxygenase
MLERFFVKAASFSMPFFLHPLINTVVRLVTASPKTPARHCAAPSEDYFHAGGLEARLFVNKATDG